MENKKTSLQRFKIIGYVMLILGIIGCGSNSTKKIELEIVVFKKIGQDYSEKYQKLIKQIVSTLKIILE